MNLLENRDDITSTIQYLYSKIKEVKNYITPDDFINIQLMYRKYLAGWIAEFYYDRNIEYDKQDEELMINSILEFINVINKIIDKNK